MLQLAGKSLDRIPMPTSGDSRSEGQRSAGHVVASLHESGGKAVEVCIGNDEIEGWV